MSNKYDEIRDLLMAETPDSVEPEQETAEIESSEEETEEVVEPEKVEAAEPEVIEDDDIVTIASLAADLEIDPGQLYGMRIPVEGHEPLTIGELKDLAQKKMEASEQAEAIQQEIADRQTELERKESELIQQATAVAPKELISAEADVTRAYADFAAVDWPTLEATNPGEAALKRQKLNEQYQMAVYNRDQINSRMEATRAEIAQQREVAVQQQAARALQTLTTLVPEWRDETIYMREREHMVNDLVDQGISEASIRGITDPALVKYLRDQWKGGKHLAEAKEKLKAPKVLKAASVRSAGLGKKQADKRLYQHAAKSTDQRVKMDAISKLIASRG